MTIMSVTTDEQMLEDLYKNMTLINLFKNWPSDEEKEDLLEEIEENEV